MITIDIIIVAVLTWYCTKLYYTQSFGFEILRSNLKEMRCSHCASKFWISRDNFRSPFYCFDCQGERK